MKWRCSDGIDENMANKTRGVSSVVFTSRVAGGGFFSFFFFLFSFFFFLFFCSEGANSEVVLFLKGKNVMVSGPDMNVPFCLGGKVRL